MIKFFKMLFIMLQAVVTGAMHVVLGLTNLSKSFETGCDEANNEVEGWAKINSATRHKRQLNALQDAGLPADFFSKLATEATQALEEIAAADETADKA
jgi:hypothetical protein